MKKVIYTTVALMTLGTGGVSRADHLSASVTSSGNQIRVEFRTQMQAAMCFMTTTRLNVEAALQEPSFPRSGKIEIDAQHLPSTYCLMASGPHRGSVIFTRGTRLPNLNVGRYQLTINGESMGVLVVDSQGARLEN